MTVMSPVGRNVTSPARDQPTDRRRVRAAIIRWSGLCVLVALLEAMTRAGTIPRVILPPPTEIVDELVSRVGEKQFFSDLGRTALEVGLSCLIGISVGLLLGIICARVRILGDTMEPYLVTLYAMPMLVFYPILLALMGLGSAPIVVITSIMVTVPVALNTMVGIRNVNPLLVKMALSVNCGRAALYRKVILPAAGPLVFSGVKLGVMYGIIGTVAMEFIIANKGLGYRIGYDYNNFDIVGMWTQIVVVMTLAILAVWLLGVAERRVRRDME